jgi:ATP-dependent Clp protease ATP-binding subunit ClpA
MDRRLAAIERGIGMTPDVDDLDREIAHVRREKESAIDSQDFETAAALRDKEKELVEHRSIDMDDLLAAVEQPAPPGSRIWLTGARHPRPCCTWLPA